MSDKEDRALLDKEDLSWLESGEADTQELSHLWPQVRNEAKEIAVIQVERLVEFRKRAQDDKLWWLDAVRSAHLALTAAMSLRWRAAPAWALWNQSRPRRCWGG